MDVPAFLALAPPFRLSLETSRIVAGPLFGGAALLLAGYAAARAFWAWSAARRLAAEVAGRRRGLRAGPIMLKGVAESAEAADTHGGEPGPLIELVIEQFGTQHRSKNGPYVRWTEVSRSLRERAFVLRTERDERVRVEPGGRLELVDRLEPPCRGPGPSQRRREAKISVGDMLWLGGVLERIGSGAEVGPYRAAGPSAGYVLRPPPRGALLVSSEPVEAQAQADTKFHRLFAVLAIAVLAICQGIVFRDFHALRARGQTGVATVEGHRTWITRSKNNVTHHYGLRLSYEVDGVHYDREDETNSWAYRAINEGASLPIVYLPADPHTMQLGRDEELGITTARTAIATMLLILVVTAYAASAVHRRPWWRKPKLIETEPGTL